jgi:FixJ family two-component response regulator
MFDSAEALIKSGDPCRTDCFIFDIRLPGISGIELNRHLIATGCKVPVIFITAHGSDEQARSGASGDSTIAYLIKPFSEEKLLNAIQAALNWKPKASA